MISQLASHSVPYQTKIFATMDLERNQMKFSLYRPSVQSIPFGPQFRTVDLSFDMANVPLQEKINLHREEWEMIYNELSKGALSINKAKKLLEKAATKIKHENENSRALHLQN